MKKVIYIFIILIIFAIVGYLYYRGRQVPLYIANYEECVRMGGQNIETYPEQCIYQDGKKFIKEATTTISVSREVSGINDQPVRSDCFDIGFKDLPVGEIYQGINAAPDFTSNTEAEKFSTIITEAMLDKPNFAGHYIIVELDCGTTCQQHAIIDAINGKIIIFGLQTSYGVEAILDSKLLIVNPQRNLPDTQEEFATTVYYELSGASQLEEICRTQNQGVKTNLEPQLKKYEDKEVGFSFTYPDSITFLDAATNTKRGLILKVEKQKINKLDGTMGYDTKTAILDQEALKTNKYGEELDWPVLASKIFVSVNGIKAKEFMVLGRFEICDVVFERKLIFYLNDYQVILTFYGDKESIISSMPEYFMVDKVNCDKAMIWKDKDSFYKGLEEKNGSIVAQFWFDSFSNIVQTVSLIK